MNFVWDQRKNRGNIAKHGLDFEDAIRIFEGPTLEIVDDRFEYGEVRVYAIGLVQGIEITVIYTDVSEGTSETSRPIISAWRSTQNERKVYWESFG